MKKDILILLLVVLLLVSSCGSSEPTGEAIKEITCSENYFEYKTGNCCLDKDSNKICDVDEETKDPLTEEDLEKSAEIAAEHFVRLWEQKRYSEMYDLLIPEIQSIKPRDQFVETFSYLEEGVEVVARLDKVSKGKSDNYYAYYTVSSPIFDVKSPAIEMLYADEEWKFDALGIVIESQCVENIQCDDKVTQNQVDECESIDKLNKIVSYCTTDYKCKIKCSKDEDFSGHYPTPTLDLNVKYSEESISIYNRENIILTGVSILINDAYRKEIGKIGAKSTIEISASGFVSEYGKEFDPRLRIENLYIYSREGKWWR